MNFFHLNHQVHTTNEDATMRKKEFITLINKHMQNVVAFDILDNYKKLFNKIRLKWLQIRF